MYDEVTNNINLSRYSRRKKNMSNEELKSEERSILLKIARQSIEDKLRGKSLTPLELEAFPLKLREPGATFVTLTRRGELRGCVGTLEAYQPLVEDVREHALAAAFNDYRFPPLELSELSEIEIEISRLTKPQPLDYKNTEELPNLLRPNIDGVILQDGIRRATFLPQVWEKLPDAETFLSHLCQKMGADPNLWRYKKLQAFTYQVEMFHE